MNSDVAIGRALAAIEKQGRISVNRGRAKPSHAKDAPADLKNEAKCDAAAWNHLKHLSGIL